MYINGIGEILSANSSSYLTLYPDIDENIDSGENNSLIMKTSMGASVNDVETRSITLTRITKEEADMEPGIKKERERLGITDK